MHSIPTYVLRYSIKEKHGIFLLLSIMFHISTFFTCHYFTFIPDICHFSPIYNLFPQFFTYFPVLSLIFRIVHLFSCFVIYFSVLSFIVHFFSCFVIYFPVLSFIVHFFSCFVTYFHVLSLISLSKHRKINQYPFS